MHKEAVKNEQGSGKDEREIEEIFPTSFFFFPFGFFIVTFLGKGKKNPRQKWKKEKKNKRKTKRKTKENNDSNHPQM